jgi:outer membrane protein assembly factor BamB
LYGAIAVVFCVAFGFSHVFGISMKMRLFLLAGALGWASLNAVGDDWPQWRGPKRDGISKESGLAKQWPESGPKLVWQNKEVAEGWGSPSIVGDTIYLLGNRAKEEESVAAYKTSDGSRVWSTKIGAVGKLNMQPSYPGARSTPTVDHGMIFVLGSDGDVAALDSKGAIKWHKNVRTDFGGESGTWAYAESPLVDGDAVVVAPGNATATVVALNRNTGAEIWRCAIPEGDQAAYASAIVVDHGGVKQYVQLLQKAMVGIDAKTGKLLWRYERAAKGSPANIPTPVERNGIIYTAGARTGAGAVRLKVDGGKVTPEEIYFDTKLPAAIGGSVLVGDTLYGTSGAGLQAVDFETGKVKWQDKSIAPGSLIFADGHLILHGEEGQVAMIEASPTAYKEQGRFTPKDAPPKGSAKTWAYPSLAAGQLYLHQGSSLWRYDLK